MKGISYLLGMIKWGYEQAKRKNSEPDGRFCGRRIVGVFYLFLTFSHAATGILRGLEKSVIPMLGIFGLPRYYCERSGKQNKKSADRIYSPRFFFRILFWAIEYPVSNTRIPPKISTKTCCFTSRVEAKTHRDITMVAGRYQRGVFFMRNAA